MKIYDISQEVLSCDVYPQDPVPKANKIFSIESGDLYNLSEFSMCAHNGTHVDTPLHFIKNGKAIDEIELSQFVGAAFVVSCEGLLEANDAEKILAKVREVSNEASKRILIKGNTTVTDSFAKVLADSGILLLGVESQSVGPIDAPMSTHLILLGKGVVLLEGARLYDVPDGEYLLCAAPLNLLGFEGSPCRAILIEM